MSLWIIGYKLHEGREGLVTSISAGSQTAPYEEISPSLEQTRLGDSTGRGVRGSKMVFCHVNAFRLPPMRHENPYSVCLQELVLRRYQSLGVTAFPRVLKLRILPFISFPLPLYYEVLAQYLKVQSF